MDEEMIYKMTGKTSKEIDEAIAYMGKRSERTKEHQRMIRQIFDVQWPHAVKTGGKESWDRVCAAIDGVIEYLQRNANYFPNYEKHMAQWETLKKVADCVCCEQGKTCDSACLEGIEKRHMEKVA